MPQPKTLVISPCVFNYENGGGVTFSNLFQGFAPHLLANLHSSSQRPDHTVCQNFYRMGNAELLRPWPFQLNNEPTLGSSPTNENQSAVGKFKSRLAGNSGLPQRFHFTSELGRWLDEFKPEVIYTILGPIPHLEAILAIKKRFGAKLVVHCMDDWHQQAYTTGLFRFQRKRMLPLLQQIFREADLCLSIGKSMATELSKRYGKQFHPFQNTIDTAAFENQIRSSKPEAPSAKLTLLYYGSVFPFAQLKGLERVAEALLGTNWELVIRTSKECLPTLAPLTQRSLPLKVEQMAAGRDDFPEHLSKATALLLPANFDQSAIDFLRHSMPTKVPGYMMSGRPILYFGPPNIAQGEYALSQKWARCVTTNSSEAVRAALEEIRESHPAIGTLVENARVVARQNHDEKLIRTSFQELLCSLK